MSDIEIRYIDHTAIPENSRICLYGIGKGGAESLKLLRQIRSDVEIVFFADTYQSGSFEGFEILSPQALVERKNEYDLILVCSCYYPEIIKHLHSLDINNVAGFSWPKFYGYQFLPDEIVTLDNEIKFILENLHSESDRALYKFLFEARGLGSDHIQLSSHDGDWAYLFKEYKEFSRKFSVHIFYSYFDFVNLSDVEYVVQAGVYDGSEALFLTGLEQIEMLYGYDPQGNTAFSEQTLQMLSDSGKFTLITKGLWNSEVIADLALDGSASFVRGIAENQDTGTVQLATLNNEAERLAIPRLDFLIADIENSEMLMLEGAMKIIERDRPQLAICFYHSKEQFLGVPIMLMKQLKNYVFKIGHYSKGLDESVFYAIPKEKFNK
ncbi:FkbM family methyltransferase [Desulfovibrio sp. JC022]|uniref:FkbM family methyltransferase n=1 Tax=Desulfovibrio sp. JC022 TaxID=2593642 RepID=UPI0013D5E34D|nr:FkbM family methyltransferase [Desulfovibrio sp. JC022]NDV24496.1 FkbM family methyltransferase [Desulfovibrio sp. JC022]